MTRILVQRGSGSSSSNQTRASTPSSSNASTQPQTVPMQVSSGARIEGIPEEGDEQVVNELTEHCADDGNNPSRSNDFPHEIPELSQNMGDNSVDGSKIGNDENQVPLVRSFSGLAITEHTKFESGGNNLEYGNNGSSVPPPPPPIPPPRPSLSNSNLRRGASDAPFIGPSRRPSGWPIPARASPSGSRPSSPRSHGDSEGYNSADEQTPCFGSSFYDFERERQFEIDIRRAKGLEVKRMLGDGNCLFRAVADQVYGDSEAYDLVRQLCIDYMERERDHFSQFVTEGFTSYCNRKRRDKVYGNNVEIQALSEMYNRPIHIYSYSTEPINIFHGNYEADLPPIRLSYHHGNHYNSLVDPRRLNVGAGLGFSSLRGRNVDKDQVKAAIKVQQDQQIDNALLAEGRFYSDLELTEKEIEHMVMEASRAEYLAGNEPMQHFGLSGSSASGAEPSSSGARGSSSENEKEKQKEFLGSRGVQIVLSMGFSDMQVMEAYSICGDDVDSMVCYLLDTNGSGRLKGKATE